MKRKRTFGYIFLLFAILLTIDSIATIPQFIELLIGISDKFSGNPDNYQKGYLLGQITAHTLIYVLTVVLWIYGLRWIKPIKQQNNS